MIFFHIEKKKAHGMDNLHKSRDRCILGARQLETPTKVIGVSHPYLTKNNLTYAVGSVNISMCNGRLGSISTQRYY